MVSIQHQSSLQHHQQQQYSDAETDRLIEKEIEAEICQRFIRLSCEKMLNARHERGGAKLHRNLLILHLLRKARTDSKRLPYECSSLLKRSPMAHQSSMVSRHLSTGAVSPPQEHVFLSEAEVEHEDQEEEMDEVQEQPQELEVVENAEIEDEDVEVDVVTCDDPTIKSQPINIQPTEEPAAPTGTPLRSVPSTYSLMDVAKPQHPQQQPKMVQVGGGPLEYKVRDQDESDRDKFNKRGSFRGNSLLIGHMSLESRFEPLHLPFSSSQDAIEEATDVASLLDENEHSKVPELSDDLDQQLQMISPPISPPEARKLDSLDDVKVFRYTTMQAPIDYDEDEDVQPPQLFNCVESDDEALSEDSGAEEDCDTDGEEEEEEVDASGCAKRRKRKTSTPRTTTVAEKRQCKVEADRDSGVDVDGVGNEAVEAKIVELQPQPQNVKPPTSQTLISVYSTGLGTTIVPQPSSTHHHHHHHHQYHHHVQPLSDQQVPVLKRIHSYPLFCK